MNFRLDGKRVLVTGAGRGLGRALADGLADAGAVVYGTSRGQAGADGIARRYDTIPLVLEINDDSSIRRTIDRVEDHGGSLDLLVNNAGVNVPKPARDLTGDDWDTVMDTNLRGSFILTTEVAKRWLDAGRSGAVVSIASQAGIVAIEERAAYGSSKAGLIHLTKVLALEWAAHRIRVNAVAPTFVRTELTASTLNQPEWAAELLSRIPIGRFGEPEDIVGAVVFLLGDAAAMITGQTIVIDGGYTIR